MVKEMVQDRSEIRQRRLGKEVRLDDSWQSDVQGSISKDWTYTERLLCALRPPLSDHLSQLHHGSGLCCLVSSFGICCRPWNSQPSGPHEKEQGRHSFTLLFWTQVEGWKSPDRHSTESAESPLQRPIFNR